MDKQPIRFVSGNEHKLKEASEILSSADVEIEAVSVRIDEVQSPDMEVIVRDKISKAFAQVGRPLFVEQTGLYIGQLNGFPGGLTQIFWDTLEADRFSNLFGTGPDPSVRAKTMIGYTDGKQTFLFEGEVSGIITAEPRGPREFQWDCVFQPDGYDKTFAELGDAKNSISMRRMALSKFVEFLGANS